MASKLSRNRRRRARRNPESETGTPSRRLKKVVVDTAYDAGAAFAAYAATRVVGRLAYGQAAKRWPGASRHVAVLASVASVAGAHYLAEFWDDAAKYEDALMMGAGVAAVQAVVQTYVPQYAYILADWQTSAPSAGNPAMLAATAAGAPATVTVSNNPDAELEQLLEENSWELHPLGQDYSADSDETLDIPS